MESSWLEILKDEFEQEYFLAIKNKLNEEIKNGKIIYPHASNFFRAFDLSPFNKTKLVIIGQDPYHGKNQANGLCFSVNKEVALPPSLKNIFKELKNDISDFNVPNHGDLTKWAKQGILMLNSVLSVRASSPASHASIGWEIFTDNVIKNISEKKENIVFLLWGKYAQKKGVNIDKNKHLVLESAHPSPFSATKFFGCRHFSKTNKYLISKNIQPIDWNLE